MTYRLIFDCLGYISNVLTAMLTIHIASVERDRPDTNSDLFRHQTIIGNGTSGLDGKRFRSIRRISRLARQGISSSVLAPALFSRAQFRYAYYA